MPDSAQRPVPETDGAHSQGMAAHDWVEQLAFDLADSLDGIPRPRRASPLPARIKALGTLLQDAYSYFDRSGRTAADESPAAEWVLDNYYIIEQALRQVQHNLPNDFYGRLPKAALGGRELARIHALAFALTKAHQNRLNLDQIRSFMQAFQSRMELTIGEVWTLAPFLRLSILENLAGALASITRLDFTEAPYPDEWLVSQGIQKNQLSITDEDVVVNGILSLRLLATQNWQDLFEEMSVVESILSEDPDHVYPRMGFGTRNRYRGVIEELSRGAGAGETSVARAAVKLAQENEDSRKRHVGYYLIGKGRGILEERIGYRPSPEHRLRHWLYRNATPFYLGSISAVTLVLWLIAIVYAAFIGGSAFQILLTLALTFLPALAVAVDVVNWLVIQIVPPFVLPRLDFRNGIPAEFRTMVVIPSLLKNESELESLLRQLENHYLGNTDPNVRFGLLTDFVDAQQKELPGEDLLIERAKLGIAELNQRYGQGGYEPFYLFHRERVWNPSEAVWMGWERKRGKLHEFNNLILGRPAPSFIAQVGDLSVLPTIRYVLTLDADTRVPRDSVHRLTGIFAHPLNQAEFDPETGALLDGYTILQPRAQVRPTVANRSHFTRVYSGDTALDLYTRAVSDVYQDLFGEGSFVGKGMYDVAAFEKSLEGRIPDNRLLSHDLFEGIHGRCGLVTNVILFEDFPPHYISYTHRLHRWIRGDWQLLPWLLPRVPHRTEGTIPNDLSVLDRWKILDNLRRSLTNPAILALILAGWWALPGSRLVWMALAISTFTLSVLFGIISAVRASRTDQYPETTARPVQQAALRALFQVIFLFHEALIALDAIGTTLVRVFYTRRRMLQWVTAAHTVHVFGKELKVRTAWNEMILAPLLSVLLYLLTFAAAPSALWVATPFLLAWTISPYIAVRISFRFSFRPERLSEEQEKQLRILSRSTWLFFEHMVGPEDHWLPPDHFQEEPRGIVAHRTSPTNIGLLLLSTLSAYDLGYIGARELALRIRDTFDGMDRLEKQRGHLLNWYDTRTLNPLPPRYISTVDSGNLAASLIALRQGCRDIPGRPIVRWEGLIDTLDTLDATLHEARLGSVADKLHEAIDYLRQQAAALRDVREDDPQNLMNLFEGGRAELEGLLADLAEASTQRLDSHKIRRLSTWIERTRHHLHHIQRDMDELYPWPLMLAKPPALFLETNLRPELEAAWTELRSVFGFRPVIEIIPTICAHALEVLARLRPLLLEDEREAIGWSEALVSKLETARGSVSGLLEELGLLDGRAEEYVQEMNFRFLYDQKRRVFHIGYNVDSGRLDSSYYDLLASEARLSSLVAIAKGDVPQTHWLHLGRPITQLQGMRSLLSWSGTMFEYLMPTLLTKRYYNTLLDQSCRAAVAHQIAYAQSRRVPWGISESAFYFFDVNQTYQYRAFGAPGLGYKRGLADDLVIAPYASVLALPFAPRAVMDNLENLKTLDMQGIYGLYEAIDFTAERLGTGQESAIVRSYMAHHQGMIMLSLCNQLRNGIMVHRFHADPRIQTVKILLQEDVPIRAPIEHARPKEIGVMHPIRASVGFDAWDVTPEAAYPQVHFLSNGNYSLLITAAGSGYSRWRDVDLTRWRSDGTRDQYGTWIYVQDAETGQLWSAAHQPVASQPEKREVRFHPHMAEFTRRDADITTHMRITIAPDADVEIRRMILTNHGGSARELLLTSYGEVILSPQANDQRHPAYNKLFIESEFLDEDNIMLLRRRPRSAQDKAVHLAHFVVDSEQSLQFIGSEADRRQFLGRGGTPRNPAALNPGRGLSNSSATLDPIFALQAHVVVPEYESSQVAFVTVAAASRDDVLSIARRFQQWHHVTKAFGEARTQAEHELTTIGLSSRQLEQDQKILSALLYPSASLRPDSTILAGNRLGQPGLWAFGISGDYPILLAAISSEKDLSMLGDLLRAHRYWLRRGLKIDLLVLNRHETSYDEGLQGQISRLLTRTNSDSSAGKRGGIFVLREDQLSDQEKTLLATVARVVLDSAAGSLPDQLRKLDRHPVRLPRFVPVIPPAPAEDQDSWVQRRTDLLFDNGVGGFSQDGREYIIHLEPGESTPAPWVNVIANPGFGFIVSEAGLGCTWAVNSGENKLTSWHNDPVSDPPSEAVYLRDEDTGQIWSPTPLPARADASYRIRHGTGYSIFEHHSHRLEQNLKVFAAPDAPVKIVQLRLRNDSTRTRRINVTYFAEWVLGTSRENTAQYIVPEFASSNFGLLASNPYSQNFGGRVAFLAATREIQGITTDRTEFLGLHGSYARPDALNRVGLTANVQAGGDPCAALQLLLWLAPGESKEVTFLLGQGADRAEALQLISEFQDLSRVQSAWDSLEGFWDDHIGGIHVDTPDKALDLLVNRWLPYQALSCRIWGRTAFYQSGGAFGFRDQLQDVMLFLNTKPEIVRAHLQEAARHQFEEGDVMHWWHPPNDQGIRTRITDNLLWLPYVTAQYVHATGDLTILDEEVPFLSAEPLNPGEHERYGQFPTGSTGTLHEHCRRALARGSTSGPHGLPLMGGGDWNDGMNNVGIEGKGESVWLGWFLHTILLDFARVCDLRPDGDTEAESYRQQAGQLQAALEAHAWDGKWYRRAYYDDGNPLGSAQNKECQIDSISQSWAVISRAGDPARVRTAMQSLYERLVDHEAGLVLLLTPAFDRTIRDPGYIKGYLPGVRENGGQYTHAALWAIWALTDLGDAVRAYELFSLINPIYDTEDSQKVQRHRVEPYVIAADVYSTPAFKAHGGWTWYTGSASWMTRVAVEKILGLQRHGDHLRLQPCIPKDWPAYEIRYHVGNTRYHIRVENPDRVSSGITSLKLDGTRLDDEQIPLEQDGGEHSVILTMGETGERAPARNTIAEGKQE